MIIIGANKDEIEIISRVLDKFKNFEDFTSKLKSIEVIDSFCITKLFKIDKYIDDGKEAYAYVDMKNKTIVMSNLKHIGIYMKKYNINCEINTFYEDMLAHELGHLWFVFLIKNNDSLREFLQVEQQGLNDSQAFIIRTFNHEIFAITFQKKLHGSKRGLNLQLSDNILFETKKRFKEAQKLMDDNPGYFVRIDTEGEFTLHKEDKAHQELYS